MDISRNGIKEVVELVGGDQISGNIGGFTVVEEPEQYSSLRKAVYKLAHSAPLQTQENLNAKYRFETETDELLSRFFDLGVALLDDNGEYRSTEDVLNDIAAKWKENGER